jgi:hypothetical protein
MTMMAQIAGNRRRDRGTAATGRPYRTAALRIWEIWERTTCACRIRLEESPSERTALI